MTKMFETVCRMVEVQSDAEWFKLSGVGMREAVAEIRELQATHATQAETIRDQLERKRRADALIAAQAQKIQELCDVLARKAFEVQVLEITQGALKMEIDRLRNSAPTIAATGAEMTILSDGTVRIKADCLSVNGDVVPA